MTNSTTGVMGGDSRTADKFVIRMPDDMRARVAKMARPLHMSMNSCMVRALEVSLQIDEENAGLRPTLEPKEEPRPIFVVGQACRFDDIPAVIKDIYFKNGILTCDVVTAVEGNWEVAYDKLKVY